MLDDGSLEEINVDEIGPHATIPPTDLIVSHEIYSSLVDYRKGKRVVTHYEWRRPLRGLTPALGGTKGDKVGVAIPEGWQITAQSYGCSEYRAGVPGNWTLHGDCGGGTYELNFYGAVWSLTQTYNVYHKGSTTLRMERTSTTAQNKVVGQYVRDTGRSSTWGIGWGPLSVSISGNKGSDKVSWDTPFTY